MALNKKQTSTATKAVIIMLIFVFVLGVGGIFAQLGSLSLPPETASTGLASQSATSTPTGIANLYQPQITTNETALKSDPKNYDLLVSTANLYSDWATDLRQYIRDGSDAQVAAKAADAYKKALAVKDTDPNVGTDYAIAVFYSGDMKGAIKVIEEVGKKNPKFAAAAFNAGIFYANDGQNVKAMAAWNRYLSLEPNGQNSAIAKEYLAQMSASTSGTAAP